MMISDDIIPQVLLHTEEDDEVASILRDVWNCADSKIIDNIDSTPYPFRSASKEEMEDWKELETEFGQDWSLQLTANLMPFEDRKDRRQSVHRQTNKKRRRLSDMENESERINVKRLSGVDERLQVLWHDDKCSEGRIVAGGQKAPVQ